MKRATHDSTAHEPTSPTLPAKLLNARQAAALLGVGPGLLYRLSKTTPGVYRCGRALRFDVHELRQAMKASR